MMDVYEQFARFYLQPLIAGISYYGTAIRTDPSMQMCWHDQFNGHLLGLLVIPQRSPL